MAIKVKKEDNNDERFELKGSKNAPKKKEVVVKEEKKEKEGYFKSVRKELKQVTWPSKKEMLKYSIATIVFVLIMSILAFLIQAGYAFLVRTF